MVTRENSAMNTQSDLNTLAAVSIESLRGMEPGKIRRTPVALGRIWPVRRDRKVLRHRKKPTLRKRQRSGCGTVGPIALSRLAKCARWHGLRDPMRRVKPRIRSEQEIPPQAGRRHDKGGRIVGKPQRRSHREIEPTRPNGQAFRGEAPLVVIRPLSVASCARAKQTTPQAGRREFQSRRPGSAQELDR